jgi:hypothetical protein
MQCEKGKSPRDLAGPEASTENNLVTHLVR